MLASGLPLMCQGQNTGRARFEACGWNMTTAAASGILLDENGVAWIEGTATKVIEVALTQRVSGLTPEELQSELPHLSRSQIYAALAHYYAHQDQMDAEIE